MPLTPSEVIINLTEDVETLIGYIKYAEDKGFVFPEQIKDDLKGINNDLETVYNEEYDDIELMED